MFGNSSSPTSGPQDKFGILHMTACEILSHIETQKQQKENVQSKLYVSFCEIYMENIFDLLEVSFVIGGRKSTPKILNMREDVSKGWYVEGLSEFLVNDVTSMFTLIQAGLNNRVTHEQILNEKSSRSHAVFNLILEQQVCEPPNDISDAAALRLPNVSIRRNVFTFGDLAGRN